jgi:cyclic-di-GMP-binding protein
MEGVRPMASEASFDIVSKVDMQELTNAVRQAEKEIETRFDFKGSKSSITIEKDELVVVSDDEYKLKSVIDILQGKMVKRGVPIRNLEYGKIEPAALGTVRQRIRLKQGIDQNAAKKINTMIRDSKLKVKSQIQGDQIRVSGKSRDDLQAVIRMLKAADVGVELQFTNYRS